jgi:hypothetical protein
MNDDAARLAHAIDSKLMFRRQIFCSDVLSGAQGGRAQAHFRPIWAAARCKTQKTGDPAVGKNDATSTTLPLYGEIWRRLTEQDPFYERF